MPPVDPVADYIARVLVPQLHSFGLHGRKSLIVGEDVQRRLYSLLAHWNDFPFRKTILSLGQEEALFYEPRTSSLEVRALVVVGVRNSLIEDLGSVRPATSALQLDHRMLSEGEITALTRAAIEHFQILDDDGRQVLIPRAAHTDLFRPLAIRYPAAWSALSHLANASGLEVTYTPTPSLAPDVSGDYPPDESLEVHRHVIQSGIDAQFDPSLRDCLRRIKEGKQPFFYTDSFKTITRNPQKLLYLLDLVLGFGSAVVTHNFFLSPTYACLRQTFLRPMHGWGEERRKFAVTVGLNNRHRKALAYFHPNRLRMIVNRLAHHLGPRPV